MANQEAWDGETIVLTAAVEDRAALLDVLARSAFFSALPLDAREEVTTSLQRLVLRAGVPVVREGDRAGDFYLIGAGGAEVWTAKVSITGDATIAAEGSVWTPDPLCETLVARLGPGDCFGEMALLLGGRRRASVRAATDLVLYVLSSESFLRVVDEHRGLTAVFEEELELRRLATSLGKASPFAKLPPEALRWLAPLLRPLVFAPGHDVVRQGEAGDALYIVQSGRAAVLSGNHDSNDDGGRQIATLGPGETFGEQSLLSGEPRAATVRALEPLEVLRLDREDFEDVVREYRERGDYFAQLALQRQRPRRIEHWELGQQVGRGGEPLFVLKDTRRHRYLKLSEQGVFLWDLIDGQRTVRDLAMAYFARYHVFGLDTVLSAMLQFNAAGFVQIQQIDAQRAAHHAPGRLRRLSAAAMPWTTRHFSLPDPDRALAFLYRILRPLYWPPVRWLLVLLTLAGAGLFMRYLLFGGAGLQPAAHAGRLALAISAGYFVQMLLHEFAHALTAKHLGRQVHRAAIGWSFFLPVGFVDTSDMWMASRRDRAAVAISGPFVDFLVAAILVLMIPLVHSANLRTLLFQFVLAGFGVGLLNLNPLLEWDGYYVLMDWLEVPNLRTKALAFIGARLWRRGRTTRDRRLIRIFTAYGLLALLYTGVVAATALTGYQAYVQGAVQHVLPTVVAALLGWLVAAAITWLILAGAWSDLRAGAPRLQST